MAKSAFNGVGLTELLLNPRNITPDIAEQIGQDFSYLMAFNQGNTLFKLLRCDADGRLLISTSDVDVQAYTISRSSILGTNILVAAANPNRRLCRILNMSAGYGFIGFDDTVSYLTGIPLPPFTEWVDDIYTGDYYVNAKTGTGQVDVVVIQV
jgi:hypothetical protein